MLLKDYFPNIGKKYEKTFFSDICFDSSKVKKDNIFFAIKGTNIDGNNFILEAQKKGASLIVASSKTLIPKIIKIPFIRVDNVRKELSLSANQFYKSNIKTKIAVTGTNGKTSITFFLKYFSYTDIFCSLFVFLVICGKFWHIGWCFSDYEAK